MSPDGYAIKVSWRKGRRAGDGELIFPQEEGSVLAVLFIEQ